MRKLSRPALGLGNARASLDADTLVLAFAPDFVNVARTHEDDLRELARKAAGRALKVRVEQGEAGSEENDEPGAAAPETQKKQLVDQAAQQPIVREALD